MNQGEKKTLLYIGIATIGLLLFIIMGPGLYNKSPENEEKTAQDLPSSNPEKPASTSPKGKNRQTSSTNTTYCPKKNQEDVFAHGRQGGSYLRKGCIVVIVAIVVTIIVRYSIAKYNNWISQNELDSHNKPCNPIDPAIVEHFNNAYGCRTSYDNLLLSRLERDYYALLPINAATIGYGSKGHHSLSKVVHKLKVLENDPRNKGLFITLHSEDKERSDTLIGHCLTLVAAIEAYKQRTKRSVIAFGETFMPKSYFIATGADKIYMGKTGTLTIHVSVVLQLLYAQQYVNNQSLNQQAQLNVAKEGDNLVCGKYKVTPCQNDLGDNFKKCYQDPYIQRVKKRKSLIQEKQYCFQNFFSSMVESITKIALFAAFASSMSSSTSFLEGITTTDAYRMGLVDDYKQEQKIIAKLGYPVQQCHACFPSLTLEAKWASIQQPAIEVLFIKGTIDTLLVQRIAPLLTLLGKAKQVKGIILVIDSTGGYADCDNAISTMLTKLKGAGKVIFTYTEGYCCSAAYFIGCTAHKMFARDTAYIGSIGARMKVPEVDHGISSLIIHMYDLQLCAQDFIDHVASCRAQSLQASKEAVAKTVRSTEARVFDGQRAKTIGLIDEIGTLDTTIAAMKKTLKDPNIKVFYREHRTNNN